MLIITNAINKHHTEISFRIWNTETKEEVYNKTIPFSEENVRIHQKTLTANFPEVYQVSYEGFRKWNKE